MRGGQDSVPGKAVAELKNPEGRTIGRVTLTDSPNGVLLDARLEQAPPGEHAFHIHEIGRCDAPTYESAGGHLNPTGAGHGFMDAKGPHLGDLPNVHVPATGRIAFELVAEGARLWAGRTSLLDSDGAAIVMHAKPDDYRSDPAGNAGARIACGVVRQQWVTEAPKER